LPWEHAGVAESPAYSVGDEWVYTDGAARWMYRVVGYQEHLLVTVSDGDPFCQGCRYFRDPHWTVVKILSESGVDTSAAAVSAAWYNSMNFRHLDFPLHVGKEWRYRVLGVTRGGVNAEFSNRHRVEAYEQVTVSGGTFKAFRISHHQENLRTNPPRTVRATHWWSPEVRAFVKRVANTAGWGPDFELQSYVLRGE
jgi:hypothetical protein